MKIYMQTVPPSGTNCVSQIPKVEAISTKVTLDSLNSFLAPHMKIV